MNVGRAIGRGMKEAPRGDPLSAGESFFQPGVFKWDRHFQHGQLGRLVGCGPGSPWAKSGNPVENNRI